MTRPIYVGGFRIDLATRDGVRSPVPLAALARAVAAALEAGGARPPASIGLILADDTELAALNAEHLGHQGPTDVLSFPLLPPEAYPRHEGQPGGTAPSVSRLPDERTRDVEFALPPGRRPHLGDIVLSVERAVAQALEGRGGQTGDVQWSAADELRLLVTHGALHICGWDHADLAEEAAMRALERRLPRRLTGVLAG